MDEFMKTLRCMLESQFPGAVSVELFLNAYEIKITPHYRGELKGSATQKINGSWCSKRE